MTLYPLERFSASGENVRQGKIMTTPGPSSLPPPPLGQGAPPPATMLGYASTFGHQAIPLTAEYAHLLNQAAIYRSNTKLLRNSGMWDLIWGVPVTLFGLMFMGVSTMRTMPPSIAWAAYV